MRCIPLLKATVSNDLLRGVRIISKFECNSRPGRVVDKKEVDGEMIAGVFCQNW